MGVLIDAASIRHGAVGADVGRLPTAGRVYNWNVNSYSLTWCWESVSVNHNFITPQHESVFCTPCCCESFVGIRSAIQVFQSRVCRDIGVSMDFESCVGMFFMLGALTVDPQLNS